MPPDSLGCRHRKRIEAIPSMAAAHHRRPSPSNRLEMKNWIWLLASAISCLLWAADASFVAVDTNCRTRRGGAITRATTPRTETSFRYCQSRLSQTDRATLWVLRASTDDNNKGATKAGATKRLDENVKNRLVKETIAPWRPLRLFLYFALGSGAMIGGLITLSGTLAAMSGARTDVDLNAEYVNLGIDFGAVAVFALLAKLDLDKSAELDVKVDEKIQKKKEQKKKVEQIQQRERLLGTLELDIRVSAAGETRQATLQELQMNARQHVILVAGPKKACRDALVGANLLKMDFAMSNVLVVPYETDVDPSDVVLGTKPVGFGERPMYETQPYVARPAGDPDAWREYVDAEMKDAVDQNGPQAREEGIAIVVRNNGKVLRRGVGKVPWRQMVEELEAASSSSSES